MTTPGTTPAAARVPPGTRAARGREGTLAMSIQDRGSPAAVTDPVLAPRERSLLRAADQAIRKGTAIGPVSDRILAGYLLAAAGAAVTQAALPGAHWAWAAFLAAAALAALAASGLAVLAARRYRGRLIRPETLDLPSRGLLARAQSAIGQALGTAVCRDGIIDAPLAAAVLDARHWELACILRSLSALSAAGGAAAAGTGQAPYRTAARAAARRVTALEDYAARVSAADRAYLAWQRPAEGSLLDLLSGAHAEQAAASELAGLLLDAEAAARYFRGDGEPGPPSAAGRPPNGTNGGPIR